MLSAAFILSVLAAWPARAATDLLASIDLLVRQGHDRPEPALRALQALDVQADDARARRALLLARGTILAQNGQDSAALGWAGALRTHGRDTGDPQAEAAAALVQALAAHHAAKLDVSATLARGALDGLRPFCAVLDAEAARPGPAPPAAGLPPAPAATQACDHRAAVQALHLLQLHASRSGLWAAATAHARAARDLAAAAGDDHRLAIATADLAYLSARSEGLDVAQPLLRQAQRLAARSGDPSLQARALLAEARLAHLRNDREGVARLAEEALPLARRAGSPRLEAQVLGFLSDAYAKQGRAAEALRAAERGLPIVRRHGDLYAELALTSNAGLAKVGLKRFAEGRADLARVEELMQAAGLHALRAEALREYDEAFAAAGDARAALGLFHRERELSAEAARRNREAVLRQLQQGNDRERQQREIELLARENQLKGAALANRELMQRVGALALAVLGLVVAVVTMLYRRARLANRQLMSNQAQLRVQSERDPLTHLANRRHFLSVMQTARALGGAERGFEGALLLVDIDHFKHVNDGHGHAVGDRVLCEVARRLTAAVRADDLVVRWGGEEFLVLAARVSEADTEALAERVLRLVGEEAVLIDGRDVPVTVSIGYANFPLPPGQLPVAWEQAINLADMALYTAKNQGRNRAVGIVAAQAESPPELRGIEADFDRAWHDGRVTLKVAPGPLAAVPA